MPVCKKCGQEKEAVDFHRDTSKRSGLATICKVCRLTVNQNWRNTHPERVKILKKRWDAENPEKSRESKRKYSSKNKDKKLARSLAYKREKRATDPLFLLKDLCRNLVAKAIKRQGYRKSSRTEQLLGCSFSQFQQHLGEKPNKNAEIDHIVPCAQAQNEEELLKLQHYTNLRWLSAEENLAKLDKKTPEGEEMCRKLLGREWRD